jgi:UvrD/REP helicase N-terminal domain
VSDTTVYNALRSAVPLVVIEAPAGCGKTHQGADYARDVSPAGVGRVLILTHTHAACSAFDVRTRTGSSRAEIRTVDSLIGQIAAAYHAGLDLPADTATWARQTRDGFAQLAIKVAGFLGVHPMLAAALARRYPIVICDEHQDCSGDQHAVSMALLTYGSRMRIFGDPMQRIYKDKALIGAREPYSWPALAAQADAFEQLDVPHRWNDGCPELGKWTLRARETLNRMRKKSTYWSRYWVISRAA